MIRNPNTCPYCHRGCGCGCGKGQPVNRSNQTFIVPVEGQSAYEIWKLYNPDSDMTEEEWLENYVKINNNYEDFEI